jgi:hypothetical protein
MLVHVHILASPKDSAHREELEKQLAPHRDLITYWSSDRILVGEDIDPEVERQLARAQIAVWFISPDFRSMEEQGVEARRALALERAGGLRILPVLVRVTTHYAAPYAGRPVFPDNKVPVSSWNDRDAAWRNVVAGIRKAAQEIAGMSQQGYAAVPSQQAAAPPRIGEGRAAGPVSSARVSAPPVSVPRESAASMSAPPVSGSPRASAPPSPRSVAYLPPSVREQLAGPQVVPEERRIPPPASPRARMGWAAGLLFLATVAVLVAVGIGYFAADSKEGGVLPVSAGGAPSTMAGGAPSATTAAPPSTTTAGAPPAEACCGGVDCPNERLKADDTSCGRPEACRPCKSGRRYVSGACGGALPGASFYKLRLAGLTTPGYGHPGTDRMCVKPGGGPSICATVAEAQFGPLLGKVRIDDLTGPLGVDVWFERDGARVATFAGMRPPKTHLSNVALCVGAVLYSADGKSIVRFFLDDP